MVVVTAEMGLCPSKWPTVWWCSGSYRTVAGIALAAYPGISQPQYCMTLARKILHTFISRFVQLCAVRPCPVTQRPPIRW